MSKDGVQTRYKLKSFWTTVGKPLLWPVLSVLIAGFSIWAVMTQVSQDSLLDLWQSLLTMKPLWVCCAILSSAVFVVSEVFSLRCGCKALGVPQSKRKNLVYAAADIFFSAITPSATGGQPASAVLMVKNGIGVIHATTVLLVNLTMCTFATAVAGLICFLFQYDIFLVFSTTSRLLILIGFLGQLLMALFLVLLVNHERLLHRISESFISFGAKVKLIRHKEKKLQSLEHKMKEYRQSVKLMRGKWHLLAQMFFWNLVQRAAQFAVTMFMFLAMDLHGASASDMWALQGYVVLGSNYMPIPGGMGVADLLMLDGFGSFLPGTVAAQLELLSRSLSFYVCVLICGIIILAYGFYKILRNKRAS